MLSREHGVIPPPLLDVAKNASEDKVKYDRYKCINVLPFHLYFFLSHGLNHECVRVCI